MEYIYGALLLHKLGKPINEENLKKVITSTGKEVNESQLKSLVVSLEGVDIGKELETATLVSATPVTAEKLEEKKAEKKEEKASEAAEGLSALFR